MTNLTSSLLALFYSAFCFVGATVTGMYTLVVVAVVAFVIALYEAFIEPPTEFVQKDSYL